MDEHLIQKLYYQPQLTGYFIKEENFGLTELFIPVLYSYTADKGGTLTRGKVAGALGCPLTSIQCQG
jgi:hypothetical protein